MSELERYIIARWAYAIGEEFITDQEYRVLEDSLKAQGEPLVLKSWSTDECPTELLMKYGLEKWIKQDFVVQGLAESIPNCPSDEMLNQYLTNNPNLSKSRLSFKLDGWNIQCHFLDGKFQRAHTRGRGQRVADAEIMKHLVHDIDIKGHVLITGELVIPNNKWEEYKSVTGNTSQRASVSTVIANNDYQFVEWITYNIDGSEVPTGDKYEILSSQGFKTPLHTYLHEGTLTIEEVKEQLEYFDSIQYEYPTDGVVFENNCFQIALRLGNYSEQIHIGTIIGYQERFGSYGTSFEVLIEPIEVGGIKRTVIPVQNLGNIQQYKLFVGGPIAFNIRSAVAPVFNTEAQLVINKKLQEKKNEMEKKDL